MKREACAWLVALTLVIGAAVAAPCWASTIVPEGVASLVHLSSNEVGAVLPVTDATFEVEVLEHPGLVMAELWAPW